MIITSAEYNKSFTDIRQFDLEILPVIAFIGRSNVGKSSLINSLLSRKKLVKTSATPGKTQLLNFFTINNAFYFVDLPGYGFAKVPENIRGKWKNMIESFFFNCPSLKLVVHILDIRHTPTNQDILFHKMLIKTGASYCAIANKVDKIKKNQVQNMINKITTVMELDRPPIKHSYPDKVGKEEIWDRINEILVEG